jgi:hypothetical protein
MLERTGSLRNSANGLAPLPRGKAWMHAMPRRLAREDVTTESPACAPMTKPTILALRDIPRRTDAIRPGLGCRHEDHLRSRSTKGELYLMTHRLMVA